jgi:hypothetical protein
LILVLILREHERRRVVACRRRLDEKNGRKHGSGEEQSPRSRHVLDVLAVLVRDWIVVYRPVDRFVGRPSPALARLATEGWRRRGRFLNGCPSTVSETLSSCRRGYAAVRSRTDRAAKLHFIASRPSCCRPCRAGGRWRRRSPS